ncbi:hypothetical protein [Pradoshia eiseniae]|uniref:hypothetical protein n=1 Tax=Pradoshia eiseniae TaxID=2064768 RepID=UPI0011AFF9C5|nr:hypothetical protein [Pradoshia eiseniae]
MYFLPFDHPLPRLFPAFLYEAREQPWDCLASPAFGHPFPHLSRMKPGNSVGFASLLPPFDHPFPILNRLKIHYLKANCVSGHANKPSSYNEAKQTFTTKK